jgi:homopolymeric O-antigen transport system permease protein
MNPSDSLPVYDSSKRGMTALEELREIFKYRNLLYQMVRRDVVTRYKRSILGIAWTMLNPLGTTLVLAIVFSQVFGGDEKYAVYVLSGLMPWTFFAQTTSACIVGLLWGGSLIHRIYMPRTVFAVSAIGTGLVNLCLSLVPLFGLIFITGVKLTWSALLLPVPILFLAMFSLGVGLFLSSIAIRFADVAEMYQIILTAWFYLSPIIYKPEFLPERFAWVIKLNPMFYLINFFRAFIYDGRFPSLEEYLLTGGIATVSLFFGWMFFSFRADEFAYRV